MVTKTFSVSQCTNLPTMLKSLVFDQILFVWEHIEHLSIRKAEIPTSYYQIISDPFVMACCLFGAKPLPLPLLIYCQLEHQKHLSEIIKQFKHFHLRKCIWECCLQNDGHVCWSLCLLIPLVCAVHKIESKELWPLCPNAWKIIAFCDILMIYLCYTCFIQ